MKKFGTPIAAGPGKENEKVGFEGEGTPPGLRGGGGGAGPAFAVWLVLVALPPPVPDFEVEPGFDPGFCGWVWDVEVVWLGGPELVVDVDVLDVVGVLVVGVEVEVLGGGVLLVGGDVVVGVHVMLALITPTGNEIDDSGVPGGTSTVSEV
jgi:hypothetical protein